MTFRILVIAVLMLKGSLSLKAQDRLKVMNFGQQVTNPVIQNGLFTINRTGKEIVYTVVVGTPARLLGYDLQTGNLVTNVEIPNTNSSWAIVSSTDGIIYIGGINGNLYSYKPDDVVINDLGRAIPSENVIFSLAAGKDGTIYGGTYPHSRVFSYKPTSGFKPILGESLSKENKYVRSIIYDAGHIYAGLGTKPDVIDIDLTSNRSVKLLKDSYSNYEFVYTMALVKRKAGNLIFNSLTSNKERKVVVFNTLKSKIEMTMPTFDVASIIADPADENKVYYTSNGYLYSYDLQSPSINARKLLQTSSSCLGSYFGKDGKLYLLTNSKNIINYDVKTGKSQSKKLELTSGKINIHSILVGPKGDIWTGGYLAGGNASYNPTLKKTSNYNGLDQTEKMLVQGQNIYFGVYPRARIYKYDTTKEWNIGKGNPELVAQIKGQDRPYAATGVENLNCVYFGTVPTYGKLGGALIEYNYLTKTTTTYDNLVKDQSILSLVYSNRVIYGGTSVAGGIGSTPASNQSVLFAWDPIQKKILFETKVLDKSLSVSALAVDKLGKIIGIADNSIFKFDPDSRKVLLIKELFPKREFLNYLRGASLVIHRSGTIYISINNALYKVNSNDFKSQKIMDDVTDITSDASGSIYFKRSSSLLKFTP